MIGNRYLKKYAIEFTTLASLGLIEIVNNYYSPFGKEYVKKRLDDYLRDYVLLKYFGYDDIIEKIEEAMVYNLSEALAMFKTFGNLLTEPKINPLRATMVCDKESIAEDLQRGSGMAEFEQETRGLSFKFDIGKFLMSKLTYMPESFDACKAVIDRYKQEDLYKVAEALDKGIQEEHADIVSSQTIEFETILDNLWKDGRVEMRKEGIKYGIPVGLGVVGTLISGPATGILAGIGVPAAGRIIGLNTERISEKVAKLITPNHCVAIYDFKKKYEIKE